jgi:L-asparaginase II
MVSLIGLGHALRDIAVRREATYLAMTRRPELVDGAGRHDTSLMRRVPGLVAKGGAEAIYVAAHPDGRAVALKVADGGERARLPVMLAALRSLGFDVDAVPVPPVLGHGRPVGHVRSLVGAV